MFERRNIVEEKMTKKEAVLEFVKTAADFVVYSSTGGACVGLMRAVLPPGVNAVVKGGMLLGGMLVSSLVASKVSEATDQCIDKSTEEFGKKVSKMKHDLDVIREKQNENESEKEMG